MQQTLQHSLQHTATHCSTPQHTLQPPSCNCCNIATVPKLLRQSHNSFNSPASAHICCNRHATVKFVAVCCSALQCVAVCCSMLPYVAVCCSTAPYICCHIYSICKKCMAKAVCCPMSPYILWQKTYVAMCFDPTVYVATYMHLSMYTLPYICIILYMLHTFIRWHIHSYVVTHIHMLPWMLRCCHIYSHVAIHIHTLPYICCYIYIYIYQPVYVAKFIHMLPCICMHPCMYLSYMSCTYASAHMNIYCNIWIYMATYEHTWYIPIVHTYTCTYPFAHMNIYCNIWIYMATYEHTWYIPMYLPIHLHTQAQWLKSQTYISFCICCQVHSHVAMCFHVCTYPSAHAGTVSSDVAIHIHMLQYVFIYFHIYIAMHIHHSVYV